MRILRRASRTPAPAPWRTHLALVALLVASIAGPASAQGETVTVRGVVFDSLRGRPLRAALVTLSGPVATTMTDSAGRFQFDSVAQGVHDITAQHPLFDSIGLSGLTKRVAVRTGAREIGLAVPSFATLWRLTCRGRAPADSGIVFGTIRHAIGGAPVSNAAVTLSWVDLLLNDTKRVVERHWNIETRSNEQGGYALCGVPLPVWRRISAHDDSSATDVIDLPSAGLRIERRDLVIGPRGSGGQRGTITGAVTDRSGSPVRGARVRLADGREARTDLDGRFTLRDVSPGTRQIEAIAIGAAPALAIADVTPGDTTPILVLIQKVLSLEAVRTSAVGRGRVLAAEFDARRRLGVGYMRDSSELARYPQFLDALRDIPSLTVHYGSSTLTITTPDGSGGMCAPRILIDGIPASVGHLIDLMPSEVGGVEVYPRARQVPGRFIPPGILPSCGMILVWTQYGFRRR